MKKRKKRRIIAIIAIANIILVAYSCRYEISSLIPYPEVTSLNLTTEQKLEDFNYFYDTVVASVPMLDEYEDRYGISFRERKEIYENLIRETQNDCEFFCTMRAISRDVPSFHFDIVLPTSYRSLGGYNNRPINNNNKVKEFNQYWNEVIEEEKEKDFSTLVFKYVDGSYIFDTDLSTEFQDSEPVKLINVNDDLIDDYICDSVLYSFRWYDGKNEKSCRSRVTFNDSIGEEVELTLETEDGITYTEKAYYSAYVECMTIVKSNQTNDDPNYIVYEFPDCSYVAINNMMNSDGRELAKKLKHLESDNVILDLRDNYGGRQFYASSYIYPALFSHNLKLNTYWYMPKTEANKSIFNQLSDLLLVLPIVNCDDYPYEQNDFGYWRSLCTRKYKGEAHNSKNIFFLTSQNTGSAADRFVSDMKTSKLATVVGNNTAGEGLAGSFNEMILPNSQLVFIYMPGGAKNQDGSDNSVYGTAPDYYVCQSVEDYYAYINSGSPNSLEEKLKYDTVFKYAYHLATGKTIC